MFGLCSSLFREFIQLLKRCLGLCSSTNKETPKGVYNSFFSGLAINKETTKKIKVILLRLVSLFKSFRIRTVSFNPILEKERDLSGAQNSLDLRLCHKFPLEPFKERLGRDTFLMKPILAILPRHHKNCTPPVESLSTCLSKFDLNSVIRCRELQLRPQLCSAKRPLK